MEEEDEFLLYLFDANLSLLRARFRDFTSGSRKFLMNYGRHQVLDAARVFVPVPQRSSQLLSQLNLPEGWWNPALEGVSVIKYVNSRLMDLFREEPRPEGIYVHQKITGFSVRRIPDESPSSNFTFAIVLDSFDFTRVSPLKPDRKRKLRSRGPFDELHASFQARFGSDLPPGLNFAENCVMGWQSRSGLSEGSFLWNDTISLREFFPLAVEKESEWFLEDEGFVSSSVVSSVPVYTPLVIQSYSEEVIYWQPSTTGSDFVAALRESALQVGVVRWNQIDSDLLNYIGLSAFRDRSRALADSRHSAKWNVSREDRDSVEFFKWFVQRKPVLALPWAFLSEPSPEVQHAQYIYFACWYGFRSLNDTGLGNPLVYVDPHPDREFPPANAREEEVHDAVADYLELLESEGLPIDLDPDRALRELPHLRRPFIGLISGDDPRRDFEQDKLSYRNVFWLSRKWHRLTLAGQSMGLPWWERKEAFEEALVLIEHQLNCRLVYEFNLPPLCFSSILVRLATFLATPEELYRELFPDCKGWIAGHSTLPRRTPETSEEIMFRKCLQQSLMFYATLRERYLDDVDLQQYPPAAAPDFPIGILGACSISTPQLSFWMLSHLNTEPWWERACRCGQSPGRYSIVMWRLFVEELCWRIGNKYDCTPFNCLDLKTNLRWQVSDSGALGAVEHNRCMFDPTDFIPDEIIQSWSPIPSPSPVVDFGPNFTGDRVEVQQGAPPDIRLSEGASGAQAPLAHFEVPNSVGTGDGLTSSLAPRMAMAASIPSILIQSTQRTLPCLRDGSKNRPSWTKDGLVDQMCLEALEDLEEIFRQDRLTGCAFHLQHWLTKHCLQTLTAQLALRLSIGVSHVLSQVEVDLLRTEDIFDCGDHNRTKELFLVLRKLYPSRKERLHTPNAAETVLNGVEAFDFFVPPDKFEKGSTARNYFSERLDQFLELLRKYQLSYPTLEWGDWEPKLFKDHTPKLTADQQAFHSLILERINKVWKKMPAATNYLFSWHLLFRNDHVVFLSRSMSQVQEVEVKKVVDLMTFIKAYSVQAEYRFLQLLNFQAFFQPSGSSSTVTGAGSSSADAKTSRKTDHSSKAGGRDFKKPRTDSKASPAKSSDPVVNCAVCGFNGHSPGTCRFISHPECNSDLTIAFADSPNGKKWLAYWKRKNENRKNIDTKARLDGSPWSAPPRQPPPGKALETKGSDKKFAGHGNKRKRGEHSLCALCCSACSALAVLDAYSSVGPSPHLMPTLIALPTVSSRYPSRHPVLQVNALLDSGSIPHSYISLKVADQLVRAGVEVDNRCAHCVRAAINSDDIVNVAVVDVGSAKVVHTDHGTCVAQCITVPVMFLTTKTKRRNDIVLTFGVLDIDYDMIVGRRDIQNYDLTKVCREYFTLPPTTTSHEAIQSPPEYTVLHSLDTVTVPASKGVPRTVDSVEGEAVALLALPPVSDSSWSEDLVLRNRRQLIDELEALRGLRLVCRRDGSARAKARGASEDILATSHSLAEDEGGSDRKNKGSTHSPLVASLNALGQVLESPSISATLSTRRIQDFLGEPGEDAFDEMIESFDISHYTDTETRSPSSTVVLPDMSHLTFEDGDAEATQSARELCEEFSTIFDTGYRPEPARVEAMELRVDTALWHRRENALPARVQGVLREAQLRQQIEVLERNHVIRKCPEAQYWSQAHLVPKPHPDPVTGEKLWRFTNDFVNLNATSSTENWPLPIISDMLQRIGSLTPRPRRFAKIDLTHGFHQCSLAQSAQIFTAFKVSWAIYCWIRVPMGLKGAPSYFQQAMQGVLGTLLFQICALYIDDILVWGETNTELLENLRLVFTKLREYNITVHPHKVFVGLNKLEFVGHVLDGEGLHFTREKIEKVLAIPLPVFDSEMKSFIGLATYFRDHVRGFAAITAPLHELIVQYEKKRKKAIQYTQAALVAFELIKKAINDCPKLYFIDDKLIIYVCTDACDIACGACIYQVVNHMIVPIMFASRKFTETERRWAIPDKEAYGMVFGCQKFEYLLRDRPFVLKTDHKNLIHLASSTSKKVVRWKLALQKFDAKIEFIEGTQNVIADALSRMVPADVPKNSENLAAMYMCQCEQCNPVSLNLLHTTRMAHFPAEEPSDPTQGFVTKSPLSRIEQEAGLPEVPTLPRWVLDTDSQMWKRATPHRELTVAAPEATSTPFVSRRQRRVQTAQKLRRTRAAIAVDGDVVRVLEPHERRVLRDLKPSQLPIEVRELLSRVHNSEVGHHGEATMLQKLAELNHYWPYMRGHVHMFVRDCPMCQKMSQIKHAVVAGHFTTASYQPMERLNIDHQGPFPQDSDGNTYILVVIDCFSRWIELYPVRSTDAETTAEALLQHFGRFGCPIQLVSDNGPAFVNETIKQLTRWLGFEWTYTLAYSKEENAIVERANKETLRHLRMIINHRKVRNQWSKFLPFVARIFNSTVKERLGVTPGTILFGNALRLDTNIFYFPKGDVPETDRPQLSKWIADKLNLQQLAVEIAKTTQLELESERFEGEGARPPITSFAAGTYVLVEDPPTTNKPKLNPILDGPFEVVGQRGNTVQIKNLINNHIRDIHVTRLRPFHYDPVVTNPLHIATQDQQEFVVERILQHQGVPKDKQHMRFLVRWDGYNADSDSWEPWYDAATGAGLRDNAKLHEYLRSKNWGYLIPRSQQIPSDAKRTHSSKRK